MAKALRTELAARHALELTHSDCLEVGARQFWLRGLNAYRAGLDVRRWSVAVLAPAVWVPEPEEVPWGARLLTLTAPFGNTLRLTEPLEPTEREGLPDWR